ncbi:MAG: pilus assembly protein PilM [Candidatus Omnitrophica bacterium]|nr:pilus assembly protein PilM [Candidatus Omnitrophota bacterium]
MKNFLRANKIRSVPGAISIPSQSAFVRLAKVPAVAPNKLHQIVLYETQQQVPFPIRDVVWDYQVFSREKHNLHVLIAAVKKDFVLSVLRLGEECGVLVEFIDISTLALFNCLRYFYRDLRQTVILDVGAKTTNIIAVHDDYFWTRSLPVGGEDINDVLSRRLNIDRNAAEEQKLQHGRALVLYYGKESAASPQEQKVAEAVTGVLTDITNEIVKTLNFYKAQENVDIDFKKMLITGGLSRIPQVERFFENSLNIPAEKIDYLNLLNFHPKADIQCSEYLGPAIGSTLRGYDRGILRVNLIPLPQQRLLDFRKKRPYWAALWLISLAGAAIALVLCGNVASLHRQHLTGLQSLIATYEANKQAVMQVDAEIAQYRQKLKKYITATKIRFTAVSVFEMMTRALPEQVWIQRLSVDVASGRVGLEGVCRRDVDAIALFQRNLKEQPLVAAVNIERVGKTAEDTIGFSFMVVLAGDNTL